MRNLVFLISTLLLLLISASCSNDDAPDDTENSIPLEASTQLEISYGSNSQQVYDLYLPAGRSSNSTKVIVLIHGGGWTEGDKADMDGVVELIQRDHPKHAILNLNYVLATISQPAFPNQVLDIDAAINQITAQMETLQILPEFGFIGISAGAHLSLLYDSGYDTDDKVKFVSNIVGPSDFTDPFYANDPTFPLALALLVDEDAYPSGTNISEVVSPVYQVNAATSPTLLFYGNQDPLVPLSNGDSLDTALSAAQVSHGFTVYQGGHGNWSAPDLINVYSQIGDYINTYLNIE